MQYAFNSLSKICEGGGSGTKRSHFFLLGVWGGGGGGGVVIAPRIPPLTLSSVPNVTKEKRETWTKQTDHC